MPFESSSAGARWITDNWPALQEFRFQWIGSDGNGARLIGEELGPLMQQASSIIGNYGAEASTDWGWAYIDGQDTEPFGPGGNPQGPRLEPLEPNTQAVGVDVEPPELLR